MASSIKIVVLFCCLGSISTGLTPSSWVSCEKSGQSSSNDGTAADTGAGESGPEAIELATVESATEPTATEPPLDVPDTPKQVEPVEMAGQYLKQFGYADDQADLQLGEAVFEDAVREFQRYAGINETGKLDELTLATMSKPRCGVKDFDKQEFIDGKNEMESDSTRRKRYVLMGTRWQKKEVTYKMVSWPRNRRTRMSKQTVGLTVDRAFRTWQSVANINFQRRRGGKVDIELGFNTGRHGSCGDPLHPPDANGGGVLAHARGPGRDPLAGDVHFNDNFAFSVSRSNAASLTNVAIHELGHSLGMSHSQRQQAIMFWQSNGLVNLDGDDKRGIRKIYGRRSSGLGNAEECHRDESGQEEEEEDEEEAAAAADGEEGDRRREPEGRCGEKRKPEVGRARERGPKPRDCNGEQRFYAGPRCKQYWDCKSGQPKLRECHRNLVFDDRKKNCNFPHNVPDCRYAR